MIERSYLSWVSGELYLTPEAFSSEARERGITLRICNPAMACELAKSGTVIYFAHNRQGKESRVCHSCSQMISCPQCHGRGLPHGARCDRCLDHGVIELGSGGWAEVDGVRWTYKKYITLRRVPNHPFWQQEHKIGKIAPCRECGGRGRVPFGVVFAAATPESVIIVTRDGRRPRVEAQITRDLEVISEREARKRWPRSRCSQRIVEGLWAMATANGEPTPLAAEIAKVLNGQAKAQGGFIEFADPVVVRGKQFIALKRWSHPAIDSCVR